MADALHQTSRWSVLVAPNELPVTWAEAKSHLRLDLDTDQAYVTSLIDAATDYAQDAMACSLMLRTIVAVFYNGERIILPRGPLIEVSSVADVNEVIVPPSGYRLEHVGHQAQLLLTADAPAVEYPLLVTYNAGYLTAAAIPAKIRLAILQHTATLYENRQSITDKAKVPVPQALADFYSLNSRKAPVA